MRPPVSSTLLFAQCLHQAEDYRENGGIRGKTHPQSEVGLPLVCFTVKPHSCTQNYLLFNMKVQPVKNQEDLVTLKIETKQERKGTISEERDTVFGAEQKKFWKTYN